MYPYTSYWFSFGIHPISKSSKSSISEKKKKKQKEKTRNIYIYVHFSSFFLIKIIKECGGKFIHSFEGKSILSFLFFFRKEK